MTFTICCHRCIRLAIVLRALSLRRRRHYDQSELRTKSERPSAGHKDGVPTGATIEKLYDNLDLMHGVQVYDGAKTYRITLPPNIPAAKFWSLTAYDNQTRSMLDTPQDYPRAGSQSYPSPAAKPDPDGSTTIHFGSQQPAVIQRGNWIQTVPGKGWNTILRLYSTTPTILYHAVAANRGPTGGPRHSAHRAA